MEEEDFRGDGCVHDLLDNWRGKCGDRGAFFMSKLVKVYVDGLSF